jgi:hypothetical protein
MKFEVESTFVGRNQREQNRQIAEKLVVALT